MDARFRMLLTRTKHQLIMLAYLLDLPINGTTVDLAKRISDEQAKRMQRNLRAIAYK